MPYKEKKINKKYFSIGELSDMIHRKASTIRYWETEFPWIAPKRKTSGDRIYSEDDVTKVMIVNIALNCGGMTISGVNKAYKRKYLVHLAQIFVAAERNYRDKTVPKKWREKLRQYPLTPAEAYEK